MNSIYKVTNTKTSEVKTFGTEKEMYEYAIADMLNDIATNGGYFEIKPLPHLLKVYMVFEGLEASLACIRNANLSLNDLKQLWEHLKDESPRYSLTLSCN